MLYPLKSNHTRTIVASHRIASHHRNGKESHESHIQYNLLIHTRECRQFWYRSSNISHGVPFQLYTTYTCNHGHGTGALCNDYKEDNFEEQKWMHHDSDIYQGSEVDCLRMFQNARRCRVTRFAKFFWSGSPRILIGFAVLVDKTRYVGWQDTLRILIGFATLVDKTRYVSW